MTPEHARTRRRLVAVAAFCAFWAALLVTIGSPVLLVGLGYLAVVVGLAAWFAGRGVVSELTPRLRRAGGAVANGARAAGGRLERIDWQRLRSRVAHGVDLASRTGRRAGAAGRRAAGVASTRALATASAAVAASRARTHVLRQRLDAARTRRAARSEALRLNAQAAALRHAGELDEALEAGGQALALLRELGDRRAAALTLNGIGLTQARSGDEAGAVDSYETAVAILTELGDSHGAGRVLANLGALHLESGHEDEARARWNDALERLEPGSPEHERTAEQLRLAG
jgi:tetratricopeptide (TPR) repeat protein